MDRSQSLNLDQRTVLRLSTQQLRFVKMLEMTAPELDEAVERELEDNPALEALDPPEDDEIPRYWLHATNRTADDYADYDFTPVASPETLVEFVNRQLSERTLPPRVEQAARYIAASLDTNGYLRRPLPSLINDMAFGPGIEVSPREAEEALRTIQDLEPYGIGAADLRETLEIQLRHLPQSTERDDALQIVETQFDAFTKKHTHRIMSMLRLDRERATKAIDLIISLNPKPGAQFNAGGESGNAVIPDLIISNEDGRLSVSTNNRIPELVVDRTFSEAVREMEKEKRNRQNLQGSEFITSRYNDARDFIKILKQRQETLLSVMTAIMKIQKAYFETEDIYRLKPMMIKDIAAMTGLDMSVISRATTNKYVQTPWGIFPLRFFFSDSIGEDQENTDALTNRKIEAEIEDIVDKEDKKHPLSDERIREIIEQRGYEVSRRTIAKYRDRKGIPVARLRKDI